MKGDEMSEEKSHYLEIVGSCRKVMTESKTVETAGDDQTPCSSQGYASFDDWYQEIEGFAVRAERLKGPVDELRAAFDAGRQGAGIMGTCSKCGSISGVYLQVCDVCMTRFNKMDA